ncbi:MAG: indole-3-glycerol phosphate synthase TrpC [Crocinitomicaceae bacterium]|nr:indole-3-glycerol phosphate synthase TrpC [Crocinitomicaceae bacterium]
MNLLDKIIQKKKEEVAYNRSNIPLGTLTQMPFFDTPCRSFKTEIRNGTGIVAEFKRRSPSAGEIQKQSVEEVVSKYSREGVSAVSILTDQSFFGGELSDLSAAKTAIKKPVLRKDFIVDEYQLFEAKAYGADAVLLIAEALDEYHATYLTTIAQSLGLEVLMELHSEEQVDKLNDAVDIIGINNRNLKTLQIDLTTSEQLLKYLPYNKVKITESGISTPDDLKRLYSLGYDGCLIGEAVLKQPTLLSELANVANDFNAAVL